MHLSSHLWQEAKVGGLQSRQAQAKSKTIAKITRAKTAGGVTQPVEYLPSKHKALNSNP
jgi:hypothetical protein